MKKSQIEMNFNHGKKVSEKTNLTSLLSFPSWIVTQNFVIPPTETHAHNKALQRLNIASCLQ